MLADEDIFSVDESPPKAISAAFPVFVQKDFELYVNRAAYQVGVDRSYPAELRRRISAAVLSYVAQIKSIDYTLKRYIQPNQYEYEDVQNRRLDLAIQRRCQNELKYLFRALEASIEKIEGGALGGVVIGDSTLARFEFSFSRAFGEANKGALYESVVIARMILEQLSWVCAISSKVDDEELISTSVTHSISVLRKHVPVAGRLYGWMSDHAHWSFEAHHKAFDFSGEYIATRLSDSRFKATAFAMLVVLTELIRQALLIFRSDRISQADVDKVREASGPDGPFDPADLLKQILEVADKELDVLVLHEMLHTNRIG